MDPDPLGSVVFLKNKLNRMNYFAEKKIMTFLLLKVEKVQYFPFPKPYQLDFQKNKNNFCLL